MSNIDWSQVITKEMKDEARLAIGNMEVAAAITRLRELADYAVIPLQDALDIGETTESEIALLKAWKKYRVALSRISEQKGYPFSIEWPRAPV